MFAARAGSWPGSGWGSGLALAWSAFPFTAFALETNSNDSLVAAMLIWGLVLARHPSARGDAGPGARREVRPGGAAAAVEPQAVPAAGPGRNLLPYVAGLASSVVATGWVLLLDGTDGIGAFWDRTIGYQLGRDSPFSVWGSTRACAGPDRRDGGGRDRPPWPCSAGRGASICLTMTALSGALLIGVELTLTHWFYLYIPWFLPFALLAIVPDWPPPLRPSRPEPEPARAPAHEPVPVPG